MYVPTNFAPYKRIELLNTLTLTKSITCPVVEGIKSGDSTDLKTIAKFTMNRQYINSIDASVYIRIFELFSPTNNGRWFLLHDGNPSSQKWIFENNITNYGFRPVGGLSFETGKEYEVILDTTRSHYKWCIL